MDAITAVQLLPVLSHLLDGALVGVGGQAWESLAHLVGRRRGHPQLTSAMEAATERPADTATISVLASALEALARTDAEFAGQLREWYVTAASSAPSQSDMSNVNLNTGPVHGQLIQTSQLNGGISIGVPPAGTPSS